MGMGSGAPDFNELVSELGLTSPPPTIDVIIEDLGPSGFA